MKKSDFNVKGKDVKILVENARKIVEQGGDCLGFSCDKCCLVGDFLNNIICSNIPVGNYKKTKIKLARDFIRHYSTHPQDRIKELERQIKRQETNIKGYKDEIKHCREILKQEERKCVTEKVELNVKLHLDGEIFTGVVVQN